MAAKFVFLFLYSSRKAVCIHKSTSSLGNNGAKIETELSGSDDVDMSNFQAEIDEATQALLKASQCKQQ